MKLWTAGRLLWTRTVGSTIVGQGIDSLIFYPLAFYGVWDDQTLLIVLVTQFALKVGWEALLTPVTYAVVGWLKRRGGVEGTGRAAGRERGCEYGVGSGEGGR